MLGVTPRPNPTASTHAQAHAPTRLSLMATSLTALTARQTLSALQSPGHDSPGLLHLSRNVDSLVVFRRTVRARVVTSEPQALMRLGSTMTSKRLSGDNKSQPTIHS